MNNLVETRREVEKNFSKRSEGNFLKPIEHRDKLGKLACPQALRSIFAKKHAENGKLLSFSHKTRGKAKNGEKS